MTDFYEKLKNKMGGSKDSPYLSDEYFVNTKTAKPNPEGRIRNNRVFVDW
jgi:hypothetical protein